VIVCPIKSQKETEWGEVVIRERDWQASIIAGLGAQGPGARLEPVPEGIYIGLSLKGRQRRCFSKWGSGLPPLFCSVWTGGSSLQRRTPKSCGMCTMRAVPEIEGELGNRVKDLGYELVDVHWAGSGRRPLLKLRIDRPNSIPGQGVSVDDCVSVSRALESWLDDHEALSESYVLEVSSPGVDRPLLRQRDFDRFQGDSVAVIGRELLLGRATRMEGELLGLRGEGSVDEAVALRLAGGEEVEVPRAEIRRVHLVFEWK